MCGIEVRVCVALFLALFAVFGHAATGSISVSVPPVTYAESYEDLRVKVLGGFIVVKHTFAGGKWHPNYNWASLQFTLDSFDASVKTIIRGKAEYTKTAPGVYSFGKRDTIRQTETGFRWADRSGNWMDFDTTGHITAYGDRNNVRVSFLYEPSGTSKRISGLRDHNDQQVIWYEYTGDLLTAIRDYTNRRVEYQYTNGQLTTFVDADHNSWTYGYTGSLPTTFTDPEGRVTTRAWASNGELASLRYADGSGVDYKYEYDSSTNIHYTQERTTSGRVIEIWTNQDGEVVRQDLNGKTIKSQTSDTYARTRSETDARGSKTVREYDQWDNVTKITYPDGATVTYTYDPVYSNVTQKIDERGIATRHEYDAQGNVIRLIEAAGRAEQRTTEFRYDQYGQRIGVRRLADLITQEAAIQYEYDSHGNVTAIIDGENYRTEFSNHDAAGNFRTMQDARQKIWTRTFDNSGRLTSQTTPLNHSLRIEYDRSGRRLRKTDAAGNATVFGYDARGNTITITDPYGAVSRFEYDADNNRIKESDQEGKSRTVEYDLDGRVTKQTDGNGNTTQSIYDDINTGGLLIKTIYPTFTQLFRHDARGRLTETRDVLDENRTLITQAQYDARGQINKVTDSGNKNKAYEYDVFGRLVKITDSAQGTTTYSYDNRDNLVEIRNPLGKLHRFAYDRRNLVTQEIRPLGQTIRYTFGPTGVLQRVVDAKGQLKTYTYDDTGRRTVESHYITSDSTTPIKTTTYTYNELDAVVTWNTGAISGTKNYDSRGLRLIGETINYGGFSLGYQYDYYANGAKRSFTGPDNVTVEYTYDGNNQLRSLALPTGLLTVNQYRWVAPERTTWPGGMTRTNTYDSLMRLTGISVKDSSQNELLNYQYSHDSAGNVLEKTTEHGIYQYSYDDVYRLTNVVNPTPLVSESYTYDLLGNRLSDSALPGSWTYDDNSQLTNYGSTAVVYDDNGNAVSRTEGASVTNFTYDSDDRLVEVAVTNSATNTASNVASYGYDPFGRRLWKQVQNVRTYYLYAQEGLVAEADSVGSITVLYGYKPHATWGTDPVYMKRGNDYYFYQNDSLGTPQQLVQQNGTVVWQGKMQSFGEVIEDASSTIENNLRFPGQYLDRETGMHYNWARNYDPKLGRYVNSDPIGLAGGLNEFLYAEGRPTVGFDPRGLATVNGNDGLAVRCVYTGNQRDAGSREVKENDQSWEGPWLCCIAVFDGLTGQGPCHTLRIRIQIREVQFFHDLYDLWRVTKTENEVECTRHENYQCTPYDKSSKRWIPGPDRREFITHVDEKWYWTRPHGTYAEVDPCPIDPPGPWDLPKGSRRGR